MKVRAGHVLLLGAAGVAAWIWWSRRSPSSPAATTSAAAIPARVLASVAWIQADPLQWFRDPSTFEEVT